mmetsp:Transcript_23274/g.31862  ORF Transcript_23274/g.31862 Transcript_23274/m.31862 type:complete len:235 (-) Transcript_23274:101-805(-)
MERTDREPCPWRIVEDAGGAFVFGLIGGTIWHGVGGARNAPRGQMLEQSFSRIKARSPMLGGSFAVWGTLFSCFDCTLTHIRKKEDPWNAILSGAATGGLLASRAGFKAAGKNALAGGMILAAIEGLSLVVSRVIMPYMEKRANAANNIVEVEVDKLLPPIDLSRNKQGMGARYRNKEDRLSGRNMSTRSTTNSSKKADSGSSGTWDAPGFVSSADSGDSASTTSASKSSWKLW